MYMNFYNNISGNHGKFKNEEGKKTEESSLLPDLPLSHFSFSLTSIVIWFWHWFVSTDCAYMYSFCNWLRWSKFAWPADHLFYKCTCPLTLIAMPLQSWWTELKTSAEQWTSEDCNSVELAYSEINDTGTQFYSRENLSIQVTIFFCVCVFFVFFFLWFTCNKGRTHYF